MWCGEGAGARHCARFRTVCLLLLVGSIIALNRHDREDAVSTGQLAPEPARDDDRVVERKGQRTRRRILEAAREVFAKVGYERATIRGIAAAAGVDKSSIIKYFGTKQGLFREAVHWDIPVAELTSDDPAETTDNYARSMLTACGRLQQLLQCDRQVGDAAARCVEYCVRDGRGHADDDDFAQSLHS